MTERGEQAVAFAEGQKAWPSKRLIDNPYGERRETPESEAWKRGWLKTHYANLKKVQPMTDPAALAELLEHGADFLDDVAPLLLANDEEPEVAPALARTLREVAAKFRAGHRCARCGHRWEGQDGAEYCGDCHRAALRLRPQEETSVYVRNASTASCGPSDPKRGSPPAPAEQTTVERPAIAQVLQRLEAYGLPAPTMCLEDNGEIGLDWHERRAASLSLNVSDDGYVGWSVLIDDWSTFGRWRVDEWPDELDKLLKRFATDAKAQPAQPHDRTGAPTWQGQRLELLNRCGQYNTTIVRYQLLLDEFGKWLKERDDKWAGLGSHYSEVLGELERRLAQLRIDLTPPAPSPASTGEPT